MAITLLSLADLLKTDTAIEDIDRLLHSFITIKDNNISFDIEDFLHNKAVSFENVDLARTYLVMSSYKNKPYLAGYFSIANKPLIIPKSVFKRLSKSLQRRLMGFGHKTDQNNFECKGYLIGQLGKNYSIEAIAANQISGADLLALAYSKILEAYRIVGGRVIHLECQNVSSLKKFYIDNGFREIEEFESPNSMCIFVKSINKL